MDRGLNTNEIQYVMDHLAPLYSGVKLGDFLKSGSTEINEDSSLAEAIIIPSSWKPIDLKEVIRIARIPVLFPCSPSTEWYSVEGKSIMFHHDILKAAFYLLSGYQEYESEDLDPYGRFPWKSSIQYQLGITQLPVVNYYFEVILEAFEKFCQANKLEFTMHRRQAPALFLSHDVDRIKKYTLRNLAISILQLLGFKSGSKGKGKQGKIVRDYALGLALFRKNPYWNFQEMIDLEEELQITSTWFFLEKTKLDNSRYKFRQKKIRQLISYLAEKGAEIGLHGTLESSTNLQTMHTSLNRLNAVCSKSVAGIRQHFLKYKLPITGKIQLAAGLDYDATLGFAEQPGFRNSYVYPFKLYDFEEQKPMDIWQLPLNVMEASLMDYMDVSVDSFNSTIRPVLDEVIRFKGLFSLLWHNCRLDEEATPGVKLVYRKLLQEIMQSGFVSLRACEAVKEFKYGDVSGKNS